MRWWMKGDNDLLLSSNAAVVTIKDEDLSGCSQVAWRYIWDVDFVGSTPATPTRIFYFLKRKGERKKQRR